MPFEFWLNHVYSLTRWLSTMDVPPDLCGPIGASNSGGRGRGSGSPLTDPSSTRVQNSAVEPLFRVKRWRRDPQPQFVAPLCKASPTDPKHLVNRWDGGSLAAQYKPIFFESLDVGGLPPPPPPPRQRGFPQRDAQPPGLPYIPPAKLSVHSISYSSQLSYCRPHQSLEISRGSTTVAPSTSFLSGTLAVPDHVINASAADSTTMLALHNQLRTQHQCEWLQLLKTAGNHSELVKASQGSPNQDEHLVKVVAKFAPSTMAAYLKSWSQWTEFCTCHQSCPYNPSIAFLADFLQVSSKRSSLGVATAQSRALTWTAKYAGFPSLLSAMQAPLTRAYIIPSEIAVRKEAAPLPLSFVVYLESCLLKDLGNTADRLLMGSILMLIWASLRWSDALWVTPSDLIIDGDVIRGVAKKTKTTTRGMPFAFLTCGFLASSESVNWATKWMNLVRQALQHTIETYPGFSPDFLIPTCGPNVDQPMFTAPMNRSQGVLVLRKFLFLSNKEASAHSIGVHSPKVTMLSWARQVGVSEEARMAQGHHRQGGAHSNVALYGRDDVHAALQLQRIVVHRVASGFRPVIPLLRGGAKPTIDKPVTVAPPAEGASPPGELQLCLPQTEDLQDTDSSDSDNDKGHDHHEVYEVPVVRAHASDCIFLLNTESAIAHVAAVCTESDPRCVLTVETETDRKSFKFACNIRRSAWDVEIVPAETFPSKFRLCMRPACAKIFD